MDENGDKKVLCRWKSRKHCNIGPEFVVIQGDLTVYKVDAIVNAANVQLIHGGGLARTIVERGGSTIQKESTEWISDHGLLKIGDAVTTTAGTLPCKFIIHTVGPNIGQMTPSAEHSKQLRRAVWNALLQADRLELKSVAVPGISTGLFGYPRDLGAQEIVRESVRFCKDKGATTTLRRIALMNIDDQTVKSLVKALHEAKEQKRVEEAMEAVDICNQLSASKVRD